MYKTVDTAQTPTPDTRPAADPTSGNAESRRMTEMEIDSLESRTRGVNVHTDSMVRQS